MDSVRARVRVRVRYDVAICVYTFPSVFTMSRVHDVAYIRCRTFVIGLFESLMALEISLINRIRIL